MKKLVPLFLLALIAPAGAAQPYKGEVEKVDAAQGKLTLKHGPIAKFDMGDGMTMVYRVADPAMLNGLKPGDHVSFDADKVNNRFTVTKMERAK